MKQSRSGWLVSQLGFLSLVILLFGCGEEVATPGAQIVPPGDATFTYQPTSGGLDTTASPLEFQVFIPGDEPDETKPMPGATVRFFGGGQVVLLTDREGVLELIDTGTVSLENTLNPDDPLFFETQTDDRGLSPTDVYAVWFVPQCKADPTTPTTKAGPDISVTGTVTATVGVASATWKVNITVKGGLGAPNGPCAP